MTATSTMILNAGINGLVNLFIAFMNFALSSWIGILISIAVVVGILGFVLYSIIRFFRPHKA